MHLRRTLVLFLALLLGGCCCPPCRTTCTVAPPPEATGGDSKTWLQDHADDWIARAKAAEPEVTQTLQRLGDEVGGDLVGLEHRLKTRPAILSKLYRLGLPEDPEKTYHDVEVYDALRYTLLVDDEPQGHHDASLQKTLAALEAAGHTVEEVKNYWPRGDTYNGVNCILRTPGGLPWELQFHTSASYAMKDVTHDDYEIMRKPSTPLPLKQRLFEKMVEVVDTLALPLGILEPKSLHATEVQRLRPAPAR